MKRPKLLTIVPPSAIELYRAGRLLYRARRLRKAAELMDELTGWVDLVFGQEDFRPVQVRAEITALLKQLAAVRPAKVLEIGSGLGGTAFLFAQVASPDATLVLVDRAFGRARRAAIRALARRGQTITALCADSQAPGTVARVGSCFTGAPVDFLFIDADHGYEGITNDFRNYSALVRRGGLIAFHDIVPDHRTRFSRETSADAGEVFRFWQELKTRYYPATREYVEDPNQDGAGVGLLYW